MQVNPGKGLWVYDLAILAAFFLAILIAHLDHKATQVTAKHEREAYEKKTDLKPRDRIALTSPIQCDATVMHSGTPGELPRTRCYQRKESK